MHDMAENKIKGLFLSEWYMMGKMFIAICVMVLASLAGSLFMTADTGEAVIGFTSVTGGIGVMMLSSSFSYDSWKGIGSFKKSMPYSDSEVVLARFLPPVIIAVVEVVCTPILLGVGGLIHGSFSEGFVGQAAFVTAVNLIYTALPVLIFYPLFFKFSYQKVQMVYGLVATVIVMSSMIFSVTATSGVKEKFPDKFWVKQMPIPVCLLIIAVIAGLFFVAFKASVAGYSKRDD